MREKEAPEGTLFHLLYSSASKTLTDHEEIFRQGTATKRRLTGRRQASFGNTALAEKIPSDVDGLDAEEY